jgi:hypothetical protein
MTVLRWALYPRSWIKRDAQIPGNHVDGPWGERLSFIGLSGGTRLNPQCRVEA